MEFAEIFANERLPYSNLLSLVQEASMLLQHQGATDNREGLEIYPNSCLSNLSDSLNLLNLLNSMKDQFHLGKLLCQYHSSAKNFETNILTKRGNDHSDFAHKTIEWMVSTLMSKSRAASTKQLSLGAKNKGMKLNNVCDGKRDFCVSRQ